ncbi:MAG: type III-B CRISPR module RAMP protein Cmr1, partial [Actinobacteria bacterium]|nr:type III-B CRISPR module RAMP protein Cmr1 [Actinomycetota bacterium]
MKKEYKLQIKTPLWTGDIDTNSNVLQPTGIIGSLRWWLEAVIRGMDKSACDPAGDDRCPRQVTKNNQKVIQYCSACLIFGATGIRRMFRLEMNGGVKLFDGGAINIKPNSRNRGWYLGSGLIGQIDLHVIPLDRDFDENLILIPLVIATNWGGIGVKTQHGYGVVEIENKMELKFEDFESVLKRIFKKDRIKNLNI